MEYKEKLFQWLREETYSMITIPSRFNSFVFFKQRYNDRLDLVYAYDEVIDDIIPLNYNPDYQGIYDRKKDIIYASGYQLNSTIGDDEFNKVAAYNLRYEFQEKVREGVEKEVGNFEKDIKLDNIFIDKYAHYAQSSARRAYLNDANVEYKYECKYEASEFERKIINYIMEPEATLQKSIDKFCKTHHDAIVNKIKENLLTKEMLEECLEGAGEHLKTMKEIIHSIPGDCKTVNVTTVMDDKELTFKFEAVPLRKDCGNSYNTWHIPKQDREKYENIYGKHKDFKPEDITKITYGRKTLYERSI